MVARELEAELARAKAAAEEEAQRRREEEEKRLQDENDRSVSVRTDLLTAWMGTKGIAASGASVEGESMRDCYAMPA